MSEKDQNQNGDIFFPGKFMDPSWPRLQGSVEEHPAAPVGMAACRWAMLFTQPPVVQTPSKAPFPWTYISGYQAVVVEPTQVHGMRQWRGVPLLPKADRGKVQSGVNDAPSVPTLHFISFSTMARCQTWQPIDFHGVGKMTESASWRGRRMARRSQRKRVNPFPLGNIGWSV